MPFICGKIEIFCLWKIHFCIPWNNFFEFKVKLKIASRKISSPTPASY